MTIEKKERLITDEATANDEQQLFNVGAMLKARQEACEKINEMFGLNISVDLRYKEENTIELQGKTFHYNLSFKSMLKFKK